MGKDQRVVHTSVASPFWQSKGNAVAGVLRPNVKFTGPGLFSAGKDGFVWFKIFSLTDYLEGYHDRPACDDLRFREELTPYSCSAFLISPQTVMTAGHCLDLPQANSKGHFAFSKNVALTGKSELRFHFSKGVAAKNNALVKKDDVYVGKTMLEGVFAYNLDYAIIQLDRPVKGITPLEINKTFRPEKKIPTRVIGHPSGMRLMHDASGSIILTSQYSKPYTFTISNSVFAGNSGSPILDNRNGKVIGVLTASNQRDRTEYYVNDRQCVTSYVVKTTDSQSQGIGVRLTVTQDYLKSASYQGDLKRLKDEK